MCNGSYYEEWRDQDKPINTITYIPLACFTVHLILSIFIGKEINKFDESKKNKELHKAAHTNLGSLKTSWVVLFLMFLAVFSLGKMNSLDPPKLNKFPNNLLVYTNQLIFSGVFSMTLNLLLFGKNKTLRREVWILFFPNDVNMVPC